MKRRIVTVIFIGIILASFISVGVLMSMGYLYAGVKKPNEIITASVHVCDANIIEKYNNYLKNGDKAEFRQAVEGFIKNDDYKEDPTCAFVAIHYYLHISKDVNKAKELLNQLRQLAASGRYSVLSLQSVRSLDLVSSEIEYVERGPVRNE